jgi:hypothetical protein
MADFNPKHDNSTRLLLAENCGQVENKTYSRNEIDRLELLATESRFSLAHICFPMLRIDVAPNHVLAGNEFPQRNTFFKLRFMWR